MKNSTEAMNYIYDLMNKYNRDNNTNHSFAVEDEDVKLVIIAGHDDDEIKCRISPYIRADMIAGDVRRFMLRVEDRHIIHNLRKELDSYKNMNILQRVKFIFKQ